MSKFIVGVTGGIGSGKSTVAELFAKLGAGVVDTDAISRQLTAPGGAAIPAIKDKFGEAFLHEDGSLNRTAMRDYVFNHPPARKQLERIMHGMIRDAVHAALEAASQPYVLLVVPLLIEVGSYRPLLSRVLVVDCEEELQVQRAAARRDMTPEAVKAIMAAQTDRKTRLRVADDVIENNGDLSSLESVVRALDRQYRAMASGAN
ncbi:MAG: dephospho-CoA kinase [Betaproteobacteria bacterium]|nr:dephospho-CoA kinase [Betaproteobacteria bacterium]MDE2621628.1 dephospho-CoA kinase [Betaproteobacteria bacterium]